MEVVVNSLFSLENLMYIKRSNSSLNSSFRFYYNKIQFRKCVEKGRTFSWSFWIVELEIIAHIYFDLLLVGQSEL